MLQGTETVNTAQNQMRASMPAADDVPPTRHLFPSVASAVIHERRCGTPVTGEVYTRHAP
jgi:hypothetical protein